MFTKLGIDWKLFIAQLINFMILFLVLRAFAWKPLLGALNERRQKISDGIDNAKNADEKLMQIEEEKEKTLTEAKAESYKIIEEAKQKANKLKEEKIHATQVEIEQKFDEAKEQIQGERNATYSALKQDIVKLISAATGKLVKNLDDKAHEKLIQDAINDLESAK